jgi:hypothetical protein
VINVREFGERLLTRDQGERARKRLSEAMREHELVVLRFDDSVVMTPSFADEMVGRLLLSIGPLAFKAHFKLEAENETLRRLVNAVLAHRRKDYDRRGGAHPGSRSTPPAQPK